jgi:hypothetical protein
MAGSFHQVTSPSQMAARVAPSRTCSAVSYLFAFSFSFRFCFVFVWSGGVPYQRCSGATTAEVVDGDQWLTGQRKLSDGVVGEKCLV